MLSIYKQRVKTYEWAKSNKRFMKAKLGSSFVVYKMSLPTRTKKKWTFAKTIHVSYWLSRKSFSSVIYEMKNLYKGQKVIAKIWSIRYEFSTKSEQDFTDHLFSTKYHSVKSFSLLVVKSLLCTKIEKSIYKSQELVKWKGGTEQHKIELVHPLQRNSPNLFLYHFINTLSVNFIFFYLYEMVIVSGTKFLHVSKNPILRCYIF